MPERIYRPLVVHGNLMLGETETVVLYTAEEDAAVARLIHAAKGPIDKEPWHTWIAVDALPADLVTWAAQQEAGDE